MVVWNRGGGRGGGQAARLHDAAKQGLGGRGLTKSDVADSIAGYYLCPLVCRM